MDEITQVIAAAQSGDPAIIKTAVVAGGVSVAVMVANGAAKLFIKGLKALAKKTATTIDDEIVEGIEKDFEAKAPKK